MKPTTATLTMQNYINGKWMASETGRTHENRNPADPDDLVCTFPDSSVKDVDAAVAAAKKAFKSWRLLPAPRRAEYLFKIGAILSRDKENFASDMTREMGKVLAETRGDVQEGIDTAYLAGGEGRRLFGDAVPCELPNKAGWSERHPIGVAGLITPWNFPMAIPEAFACGKPVISSQLGAMAEIVRNSSTGLLFKAGDSADLAAKMHWMTENTEACMEIGKKARAEFEGKYTAGRNFDMLMDIYRKANASNRH